MVTPDYERALLGAVLQGFPDVPALARVVCEADFDNVAHGAIWEACVTVHAKGERVDSMAVLEVMGKTAHRLPGGATYLTELDAPVVVKAPHYAAKVRELAIRRQVQSLGIRCQQMLEDPDLSVDDLLSRIRTWADEIQAEQRAGATSVDDALERVLTLAEKGAALGMQSPWLDLTEALGGGWFPGLYIVAARPGVGKTLMLENIGTDMARRHGKFVAFASLEMTAEEITQRTLAHTSKVELSKIRAGGSHLSPQHWQAIHEASGRMVGTRVRYDDRPAQTIDHIRAFAWETRQEALRAGGELGMVVVDYLQFMEARDRRLSRQQQVGEMSRGLKRLSKELQVPVVAGAQLNRGGAQRADSTPLLTDLREAGDIEQDADVVMLMHEEVDPERVPTGTIDVYLGKNRHGAQKHVKFQRYGHYSRMEAA